MLRQNELRRQYLRQNADHPSLTTANGLSAEMN